MEEWTGELTYRKQIERNGNWKPNQTSNCIKCERSKHPNQNAEIGRLDKNTRSNHMLSSRHLSFKDTNRSEVRGWKRYTTQTVELQRTRVVLLIPDKVDLKTHISRDKQGCFIMMEEVIPEKDTTIINIYMHLTGLKIHEVKMDSYLRDNPGERGGDKVAVSPSSQLWPPIFLPNCTAYISTCCNHPFTCLAHSEPLPFVCAV